MSIVFVTRHGTREQVTRSQANTEQGNRSQGNSLWIRGLSWSLSGRKKMSTPPTGLELRRTAFTEWLGNVLLKNLKYKWSKKNEKIKKSYLNFLFVCDARRIGCNTLRILFCHGAPLGHFKVRCFGVKSNFDCIAFGNIVT